MSQALAIGPNAAAALAWRGATVHSGRIGTLEAAWTGLAAPLRAGPVTTLLDGELRSHAPERLAELWLERGERLLGDLRGDFVLLVADERDGTTLAVRDHFAGRPLSWAREGGAIVAASELRDVLGMRSVAPRADDVAMAHWLAGSAVPAGRSLVEGVQRLGAGELLDLGNGATRAWWVPRYERPLRAPRAELVATLREALREAVGRRLPAGVLLSGGLDSSAVAALAGGGLRAYSAVFPDHPSIDEAPLIDELCEVLGLESARAVVRTGSVLAGALPYLERWGMPALSPNLFFWLPLLRRAAADGTGALLTGEGGDEVFGLSPYLLADHVRHGRLGTARRLVAEIPGVTGGPPGPAAARRLLREYGYKGAVPRGVHRAVRRSRGAARYVAPWLRPEAAERFEATQELQSWKALRGPRAWAYLAGTTRGARVEHVVDHARRRGELAGVGTRHPFYDPDLNELVLRLPPELAFDARHSRPLLREALAGLLPDAVRLRPAKSTFDAVFHEAMQGPDLPALRALLGDPDARVNTWLDGDALRAVLAEPPEPQGRAAWAVRMWRAAGAELWLRWLEDPDAPRALLERQAGCAAIDTRLTMIRPIAQAGGQATAQREV